MIQDIGNELVPVITPEYDTENPIKSSIKVKRFLEESWIPKSTNFYLHQWQFPLSSSKETINKLCYQSNPVPTLGLDLLQYGYDSLSSKQDKSLRDSPFQYLFMGAADTHTKMHRDTGGMSILIAPIIGKKEVILCHRY